MKEKDLMGVGQEPAGNRVAASRAGGGSRRRWGRAGGFVLGVVVLAVVVVAGSVRFEAYCRHRGGKDPAVVGCVRSWLTKPVADAVSEGVRRHIRARIEARQRILLGDVSVADTIRGLEDTGLPMQERGVYAARLAMLGDKEGLAALLRVFRESKGADKAFFTQLLGSTGREKFLPAVAALLKDEDAELRVAAIRALGGIGGAEAVSLLGGVLADGELPVAERTEAAAALGAVGSPAARDALLAALPDFPRDQQAEVLRALGRFPFEGVRDVLEPFVGDADVEVDARVEVVEALANSTRDCVPYLLDLAGRDASEDLRAAAAWTVGTHGRSEGAGARLFAMVRQEEDTMVRRRLYEAMIPQGDVPVREVLAQALAEPDTPARVAGYNAAGAALAGASGPGAEAFDSGAVPDLLSIALLPNSLNIRMRSVFALRRANTPGSLNALQMISGAEVPAELAAAARSGLPASAMR